MNERRDYLHKTYNVIHALTGDIIMHDASAGEIVNAGYSKDRNNPNKYSKTDHVYLDKYKFEVCRTINENEFIARQLRAQGMTVPDYAVKYLHIIGKGNFTADSLIKWCVLNHRYGGKNLDKEPGKVYTFQR